MKTNHQALQSEMSSLIKNSCAVSPTLNSESYSFHKSLLKFFFGALDVSIDYEKKKITLVTSISSMQQKGLSPDSEETVLIDINYTNLENQLLECLEMGEKQSRFYKSLLFHYNHVAKRMGVWKA